MVLLCFPMALLCFPMVLLRFPMFPVVLLLTREGVTESEACYSIGTAGAHGFSKAAMENVMLFYAFFERLGTFSKTL